MRFDAEKISINNNLCNLSKHKKALYIKIIHTYNIILLFLAEALYEFFISFLL